MKILVTGGCGFVGSNISLYLKKKGHDIASLDNLSRKGSIYNLSLLKKEKIINYNIDISNYNKIKKLPKYNLIIDCCAEAAVEVSRKDIDKVFNTNLVGTFNILKKVKNDKSKIIFLSSSRVYPIKLFNKTIKSKILKKRLIVKKLINENDSTSGPKTIYGSTKLASEMFIEEFSYAYKIKYLINRCGVISGPLQFGKQDQGFVSLWIWRHLIKKNLSYVGYGGYGNQIRDVLHIDDLCEIIHLQIRKLNKIYNHIFTLGGSKKSLISLKELTIICQKLTGNKIKLNQKKNTSIYDIPFYVSDNSKIQQFYKWKPKRDILRIVQDTYKWLFINKKKINKYF